MSPESLTPSLLTLSDLRRQRLHLTERDLLRRCRDAARLELRGKMWSPDDREDAAAAIMLDVLARTHGAPPISTDPRYSLGSMCKRVQTWRRSAERQRNRDLQHILAIEDASAWTQDAMMPYIADEEETTEADARMVATHACRKLGFSDRSNTPIWTLIYGYTRDVVGPICAAELEISANAYDVRCLRAKALIRAVYPDARSLLTRLVGAPIAALDPMTSEEILRFAIGDHTSEAHGHTQAMAQPWREGTDNGRSPARAESADHARSMCNVAHQRPAPARAERNRKRAHKDTSPEQMLADSLRSLGRAYASARKGIMSAPNKTQRYGGAVVEPIGA